MSSGLRRNYQVLPMKLVSIDLLLSLRIYFASADDNELNEHITQVSEHPQALHNSVLPRWREFVERALLLYARNHYSQDPATIIEPLVNDVEELPLANDSYQLCLREIQSAQKTQPSGPLERAERSWRQQLMALLLPIISQCHHQPDDGLDSVC